MRNLQIKSERYLSLFVESMDIFFLIPCIHLILSSLHSIKFLIYNGDIHIFIEDKFATNAKLV